MKGTAHILKSHQKKYEPNSSGKALFLSFKIYSSFSPILCFSWDIHAAYTQNQPEGQEQGRSRGVVLGSPREKPQAPTRPKDLGDMAGCTAGTCDTLRVGFP